jgi:hypothetical protein
MVLWNVQGQRRQLVLDENRLLYSLSGHLRYLIECNHLLCIAVQELEDLGLLDRVCTSAWRPPAPLQRSLVCMVTIIRPPNHV